MVLRAFDERARTRLRLSRTVGFVYQFHHLLAEFDGPRQCRPADERIAGMSRGPGAPSAPRRLLDDPRSGSSGMTHQPAQLSGGETAACRHRPRPWPTSPSLLLADEPTGNLDPATTSQSVFESPVRDLAKTSKASPP